MVRNATYGGPELAERHADYAKTRSEKEDFHKDDQCFIGIDYADCMNDTKLEELFEPFIGRPSVTMTRQDFPQLSATRWSIADGVLDTAKKIMDRIDGDSFPTLDWLRRKGNYENRVIADWEAVSYEHFIDNIYLIGGLNSLRLALGQDGAPTRESVLVEAKDFFKTVKRTPCAAVSFYQRKKDLTEDERRVYNQGQHLVNYAKKFFGGHRQLCEAAGIAVRVTKAPTKPKSKPVKKAVQQFDMQNKLLHTFANSSEAARKTDLKNSNISACCNEKAPCAGGFIWKFV